MVGHDHPVAISWPGTSVGTLRAPAAGDQPRMVAVAGHLAADGGRRATELDRDLPETPPARSWSAIAIRSSSDKNRAEITGRWAGAITGGVRRRQPSRSRMVRPYLQRVPVRRWLPNSRHAAELLHPFAISAK